MLHLFKLFSQDVIKLWAVLIWGLFSIIYIIENGAVLNADIVEKYQYYFLVGASIILLDRVIYFLKYHRFILYSSAIPTILTASVISHTPDNAIILSPSDRYFDFATSKPPSIIRYNRKIS